MIYGRLIACILVFVFSFSVVWGQTNPVGASTLVHDDCGDPDVESQIYVHREGTVIGIKSSNILLVRGSRGNGNSDTRQFEIRLVGVESGKNARNVKNFLTEHLLHQSIEIIGNAGKPRSIKYGAFVFSAAEDESGEDIAFVNEYLIENGLAIYSKFKSDNLVPSYWPCQLEKAQERAKANRLGLWKN